MDLLSSSQDRQVRELPAVWTHRTPHRVYLGPLNLDREPEPAPAANQDRGPVQRGTKDLRARRVASPWQVLMVLCRTDFRARYRAQALGVVWSLLNPLVMMGIMSLIFTKVFRTQTAHFPIFLLIGLIVWQWVTSSLGSATQVFVAHAEVIKRTVFSRHLLPVAVVLSYGINFCVESLALIAFVPIFPGAFRLSPALLLVPVLLFLFAVLLTSIVLATSVLNVIYRDVAYLVNTALLILYWLTPVFYSVDLIPQPYRMVLQANPIGGIMTALRGVVMQGQVPSLLAWAGILLPTLILLGAGWLIFRHYERMVLDYV